MTDTKTPTDAGKLLALREKYLALVAEFKEAGLPNVLYFYDGSKDEDLLRAYTNPTRRSVYIAARTLTKDNFAGETVVEIHADSLQLLLPELFTALNIALTRPTDTQNEELEALEKAGGER